MNHEILEKILLERWGKVYEQAWKRSGKTDELNDFGRTFQWLCRFLPKEIAQCKHLIENIYTITSLLKEHEEEYDLSYWHRILSFQLGALSVKEITDNPYASRHGAANLCAGPSGLRYYIYECMMWLEDNIPLGGLIHSIETNLERRQTGHDALFLSLVNGWNSFDKDVAIEILKKDFIDKSEITRFTDSGKCRIKNTLLPIYLKGQEDALTILFQVLEAGLSTKGHQQNLFIEQMPLMLRLKEQLKETKLNKSYFDIEYSK